MSTITEDVLGAFRRITLANGLVHAQFLPELGGKITSLVRIATAHEFLLQPQRPLRHAAYGDHFEAYDTSGFDECVPTVATCRYPRTGELLPDHGELWSVPWDVHINRGQLHLVAGGRALPYRLEKAVHLEATESSSTIRLSIAATPTSSFCGPHIRCCRLNLAVASCFRATSMNCS